MSLYLYYEKDTFKKALIMLRLLEESKILFLHPGRNINTDTDTTDFQRIRNPDWAIKKIASNNQKETRSTLVSYYLE